MVPWLNFLSLIPSITVTLLLISIAFLRFYNEQDFTFLGLIANPRTWSNRLTVAALTAAVVNFCVEWDRRNRETDRLAEEVQRRLEEEQRRVEEVQRRTAEEQRSIQEEQRSNEATKNDDADWLKNKRRETEELRQKNRKLAELQSKLNEILHS